MNTKEIKLIAMDMDGTLLNENKEISKESRKALLEAVDKGIAIAICSGRSSGDNSIYAANAGLTQCYIIGYNGAYCLEAPHGEAYSRHFLGKDTALSCLAVLDEYGVNYACFLPHLILASQEKQPMSIGWATHVDKPGAPQLRYSLEEIQSLKGEGINKIVYSEREDVGRVEEIRRRLSSVQGVDITSSWVNNLELMPAGINKGTALRELAERLGFSRSNVMALGDFDNDIPMLLYAGCGVAMGNASQGLRTVARHQTATNALEGVAQAIRQYAL